MNDRQRTIIIYNYADDPLDDQRCNKCGHLLMQVKGQTAFIVTTPGLPLHLVKMPIGGYLRHKCRKCGILYNILIYTFEKPFVSDIVSL